nr:acetate kinase [uncultured Carboxylicivirga sp.]
MIILVLNSGSSSIKYQLFNIEGQEKLMAKGVIERIGIEGGALKQCVKGVPQLVFEKSIPDHTVGLKLIFEHLVNSTDGVLKDLSEIDAVGHRVVHGGELFKDSIVINEKVKQQIAECAELAPLHNPANLKGILSVEVLLPNVPQVAVFDTSFHQTMPKHAFLYGIPYKYYEKYKIRRYGFHGISHKYVAQEAAKLCKKDFTKSKIITCHLGNGASITAIDQGESVDTSMGFTPVTGLMMGTRCGSVDPGVLLFLEEKEQLSIRGISSLINKESGLQGISELSSDMRDIEQAAIDGVYRAKLALDMYIYRVRKKIASFVGVMDGLDTLVFTGGVGENSFKVREEVCKKLSFFGVKIDQQQNLSTCGQTGVISSSDSSVTVVVINTNEELVIARETFEILNKN